MNETDTSSRERIEVGLAEIRKVVGSTHIITEKTEVDRRARTIIPFRQLPCAFIYPGSAAEIREIVRIANVHKLPLWPSSRGKNWGYGAATPAQAGTAMLMLERMNRIITVDAELAYAEIEPGVSYRQLQQYLTEHGIPLMPDATDGPPDGSVIGNALERGLGETPYGDHFGHICGMEVVLPNGDLIQTGAGPHDALKTWHTHKWGSGPYLEGIFTQSNFGIVTKAGIWLMPQPEVFNSFTIDITHEEDLPKVIDVLRVLSLGGELSSICHICNDVCALALFTQVPPAQTRTRLSESERAALRKQLGLTPWLIGGGIYGSRGAVAVARKAIRSKMGRYGRIDFITDTKVRLGEISMPVLKRLKSLPPVSRAAERLLRAVVGKSIDLVEAAPHIHGVMRGRPTEFFVRHAYFRSSVPKPDRDVDPARDGCGSIWFAPIAPLTGKHVGEVIELCRPLFEKYGFDYYAALLMQNARSVVILMSVFFQKDDEQQAEKARRLYHELRAVTIAAGYQQYRTSVAGMEHILDPAPELKQLLGRIKAAVDPNNIIAPGKYGIVPQA